MLFDLKIFSYFGFIGHLKSHRTVKANIRTANRNERIRTSFFDFKEFTFSLLPTFQTNIYSNNVNISEAFLNKDFIVIFLWSLNSSFRNVFSNKAIQT